MSYGTPNIYLATIVEVQKSSVKVRYNNTISDFVPYTQVHNAFKTAYSPPAIGEIVLYFKLGALGIVLGTSILPTETEEKQDEKTQRTELRRWHDYHLHRGHAQSGESQRDHTRVRKRHFQNRPKG